MRAALLLVSLIAIAPAVIACKPKKELRFLKSVEAPPSPAPRALEPRIRLETEYCTREARAVHHETHFLLVLDNSGSNYVTRPTDPDGSRRYLSLLTFLDSLPSKYPPEAIARFKFGLVVFNDKDFFQLGTQARTKNGWMNRAKEYGHAASFLSIDEIRTVIGRDYEKLLAAGCGATSCTGYKELGYTDYILALKEAHAVIQEDIDRVRTQASLNPSAAVSKPFYVMGFVSDGAPLRGDAMGYPVAIPYSELRGQLQQILDSVNQVHKDWTMGIQLHTVLYDIDPANVANPAECQVTPISRLERCPRQLLRELARQGLGEFFEVYQNSAIPWDRFGVPSLNVQSNLVDFFIRNRDLAWTADSRLAASPLGDGLTAETRAKHGYLPFAWDSDGDGISDSIDLLIKNGLGPGEATRCSRLGTSADLGDEDGDGLNRLEETCLGTRPDQFDSNGDGVPDGLAVRSGIGAVAGDLGSLADSDEDGLSNLLELKKSTPIHAANASIEGLLPVITSANEAERSGGRSCYRLLAENVPYLNACDRIELLAIEMDASLSTGRALRRSEFRVRDFLRNEEATPCPN